MRLSPRRILAAIAAALLIPACGGSSSSSVPAIVVPPIVFPPGPGPVTLISDDWAGGAISSNWVIVRAPATVDTTVGVPPASMIIGDSTDGGEVRSFHKFNVANPNPFGGITIEMDVAFLSESPSIKIWDADRYPTLPGVEAIAFFFDAAIAYRIGTDTYQQNVVNDGNWHRLTFQIGSGTASWKWDGVTQLVAPLTVDWIMIEITSGLFVSVWIDNVLVTAP